MDNEQPTATTIANPSMLRALLIVSTINTSLWAVIYGISLLFMNVVGGMPYPDYEALFQQGANQWGVDAEALARSGEVLRIIHDHGAALFGSLFARTVARLIGVVLMWRGRLMGFHVYTIAQLAGIFLPHLVLPWAYLGFFGPLMAVGMAALYGSQRQLLTK